MKENVWRFIDTLASFEYRAADKLKGLYLLLCNERIMSSITPDLHGDIKTGQNSFLLTPVSRIDLTTSRASRNFWVNINKDKIWSATGVSKDLKTIQEDKFVLEAGLLWQKITRQNQEIGLKAEILSFVPASNESVEIMQVTLTNISKQPISFIPTAAIPIYARGANNIRDHRHVTSLLQRIALHKYGVISKPTLSFDESGHKPNTNNYFVLGWGQAFKAPQYLYPTQEVFCGDEGDLEAPSVILNNSLPKNDFIQGKEAMGGLRFREIALKPGKSHSYIVIMGITDNQKEITKIISRFNSLKKVEKALIATKEYWITQSQKVNLNSGDQDFDNWLRWVSIQPRLRKIFGCSFLPDFDYGKGGRGWRDLWQDCLGLILNDPASVRQTLVNNFSGVRIDGSNATIIGKNPGEFIADRNDIARVWMDHGVWPLLTLDLYINETGDRGIIFEKTNYFCDQHIFRSRKINKDWNPAQGNKLITVKGSIYFSSILEHLLVQNLVQFFNVGRHNIIRLEGADWNDGLDMAAEEGEGVAFSAMYAQNLATIADLIVKSGKKKITIVKEINILLKEINYKNIRAKISLLNEYFEQVKNKISGKVVEIDADWLARDLKDKSDWLMQHIRGQEWLKEGFFNGYYDNSMRQVEGRKNGLMRMILTGQVFAIMSGVAQTKKIDKIIKSVEKYLYDKKLKGYRLNTDFGQEQHNLGRAFSFNYGDKENGAFFNHMIVMYAYALYRRGFVEEGWKALGSIYGMVVDKQRSKIYPCLPEYFNLEGRGMYSYLTGSASWFMLTLLTQVFGVRGENGNLIIEPKLCAEQFKHRNKIILERKFGGKRLRVSFSYLVPGNNLKITKIYLDSIPLPFESRNLIVIQRKSLLRLKNKEIKIDIILGS